ncbi:MAG: BadF/BadG/BcrA/BcrD ATPase family protein, partial [Planctomycetota bacterium]
MLPPSQCLIGVDGGASRTRAELFSEGATKFRSETGPSNPGVVGVQAGVAAVGEVVDAVLAASGTSRSRLAAIGLGIAGIGPEQSPLRRDFQAELRARLGALPVGLWTDQEIALAGAFGGGRGILVVGGTGSGALGFDGKALVRAGGWGRHLRDPGSAFELFRDATLSLLAIRDGLSNARSSLCHALPGVLGLR